MIASTGTELCGTVGIMTVRVMSVQQVRDAEGATMRTVSEAELMARAADAVAAECETIAWTRRGRLDRAAVVVLAGPGNNGGDALLAGARLAHRGARVTAVMVGDTAHGPSLEEAQSARVAVLAAAGDAALAAVRQADIVIDGIAGLGSSSGLRPPADALVAAINDAAVVAVDIPSGLAADSSSADAPHVVADVTVTFTAAKRCLVEAPAAESAGRVVVAQVGIVAQPG